MNYWDKITYKQMLVDMNVTDRLATKRMIDKMFPIGSIGRDNMVTVNRIINDESSIHRHTWGAAAVRAFNDVHKNTIRKYKNEITVYLREYMVEEY